MVIVVASVLLSIVAYADNISIRSGHSYYAKLEAISETLHWAGLIVNHNTNSLSESTSWFASMTLNTPVISSTQFAGDNLKDGQHYYAAMVSDTLSLSLIKNVSSTDLEESNMFDQGNFSTFYPSYSLMKDSPNGTFCCSTEQITISGTNFTAFKITQQSNVEYYLLKYGEGTGTPLFIVPIKDATCYNSTACVSQFLLPISDESYYFYALSAFPSYQYTVYVDGAQTSTISQTALPYNVTIDVVNAVTSQPAPNVSIVVGEDDGQNLFIPYRLSGYISESYSVGLTDGSGRETFLVAPTVYPSITNYSLYVGVINNGIIGSKQEITITQKDSLVQQSKPLTPSSLFDNAKVSVNAMNQINSFLFQWSSQLLQAKKFTVVYELNSNSFTVVDHVSGGSNMTLKTGAPNVVTLSVTSGGIPQSGYNGRIKEQGGYLIMNPYTASSPFTAKTRVGRQLVPTLTEFIVTPTSLGTIQPNITFEVVDSTGSTVDTLTAYIDPSLNIVSGGAFYNNDLLKTVVNAMNSVLSSLYYSLNN